MKCSNYLKVEDGSSVLLDHLTFCTLSTLSKLLNDDVIRNPNYSELLIEMWGKQVVELLPLLLMRFGVCS